MQTKIFSNNAFFSGVLCALFSGLVFIVASCGDDSKPDDTPEPSSSSEEVVAIEGAEPKWNAFNINFYSNETQLEINVSLDIQTLDETVVFDYVTVTLDGAEINRGGTDRQKFSYSTGDSPIALSEATCGQEINVLVKAYVAGALFAEDNRTLTRDADKTACRSSSSETPSSSSVAVNKTLVPVAFGAACEDPRCIDYQGTVIPNHCFISSNLGADISNAARGGELFFNGALTTDAASEITDQFDDQSGFGTCEAVGAWGATQWNGSTSPLFGACERAQYGQAIDSDTEGAFHLFRAAGASSEEWGTGWYLVRYTEKVTAAQNPGICIQAWKAQ